MLHAAIAAGGVAGAIARHGAGMLVVASGGSIFPWGTLAVNVCGSWMLGVLMRWLPGTTVRPAVRAALTIGFCGGFTTFSTFAYETVALSRQGDVTLAAAYVASSLALGVVAMFIGMEMAALVTRRRAGPPEGAR